MHYISALVPRYRVSGHLREGTRAEQWEVGRGLFAVRLSGSDGAAKSALHLAPPKREEEESDHEHERPTSSGDGTIAVFLFLVSTIREVGNDLILIPDGVDRGQR